MPDLVFLHGHILTSHTNTDEARRSSRKGWRTGEATERLREPYGASTEQESSVILTALRRIEKGAKQ